MENKKIKNADLKKRIISISYKNKLSHLGSCLTAVDIIDEIYATKKLKEKFILSSGHAGLAQYVVIEKYTRKLIVDEKERKTYFIAEHMLKGHGIHPERCSQCMLDCSSGSLGQGLPIAVGMALADRSKNVYCLISDGECSEGSIWEAFRIQKEQELENLIVYVNINSWGAYKQINPVQLHNQLEYMSWAKPIWAKLDDYPEWLQTQEAHYKVMNEDDYKQAMEVLK